MNKIITRIKGGIGNQLFCYAAARRLALVNNAELVIDDVSGFVRDYQYQRQYGLDCFNISARKATWFERLEPFERYRRALMKRMSLRKPFDKRCYIEQEKVEFDDSLLDIKVNGTIYLDGLWQSEKYFKDVEHTIKTDLSIQSPTDQANIKMASSIEACLSVGIHMRWFDAFNIDSIINDYYHKAIECMDALEPHAHYFLFSDDPAAALKCLALPKERVTCITHNQDESKAYADLWLMSKCNHFITANSTFSWWGAWLGNQINKRVITPKASIKEGIAWWGFDGLIPDEWIKL